MQLERVPVVEINQEALKHICELNGWRYPAHSRIGEKCGVKRSYVSQVFSGKKQPSMAFYLIYPMKFGVKAERVWTHKEEYHRKTPQSDNNAKYNGEKPYVQWSPEGESRKRDAAMALERPLEEPAAGFYESYVPKAAYCKNRYKR